MLNKTADVLSCNSNIDHTNIDPSLVASFFDGPFNCKDGLVNIEHNSLYDTFRLGFAHPQYFEFTKLIFAANYGTYLCSANVQPDYKFFLFHGCKSLLVVVMFLLVKIMFHF